jgi:hypothetical protein
MENSDRSHRYPARYRHYGVAATARYHSDMRTVQEHIDSLGARWLRQIGPIEYARIGMVLVGRARQRGRS